VLIHVEDVRELRTNLDEALQDLGIQMSAYTDANLKGFVEDPVNATMIRAVHIRELRDRVRTGIGGSGGGGGGFKIYWLITDHLGTPRMLVDQSGTVGNIKRHDYLPFGEELFVGTGGRLGAEGYGCAPGQQGCNNDNVRQQFTQKERDLETGLDFFGARYHASLQGRFISPDPLLSSGLPGNPQTWNRYLYAVNNPLSVTDPTGLFIITGASQTEVEQIIATYHALLAARNRLTVGSRAYNNLTRALARLGKPGEANGIVVRIGRPQNPGARGDTNVNNIARGTVTITLKRSSFASDDVQGRAEALAHEAVHADDAFNVFAKSKSFADFKQKWEANDNQYQTEYDAFFAGAGVYQGIGRFNRIYGYGWFTRPHLPGKNPYLPARLDFWNPSWRTLDQKQIESKQSESIRTIIESPKGSGPASLYGYKPPRNFQP